MKRKYLSVIAALTLGGLGFTLWTLRKPSPQNAAAQSSVKRGVIVEAVYGIGTLTAQRSLSFKSGVTTTIKKLYIKEGDVVEKGRHLADFEGIGPFSAPFAGTITSLPFKEGETVFAQTVVLSLVDLRETYLLVTLEQQGALKVKPGLPVRVSFDGMRDQRFEGRVESVYANGPDFLARIAVEHLPSTILPGMTADVGIVLQKKENAILLPVAALDGKDALLRRSGREVRVPVDLGINDGAYVEVLNGNIQDGEQVVISGRTGP